MSSEQQSSEVPAPSDVIMKQEAPQQPQDKAQDAQQAQDLPSKVNEQSTTAGPDGKVQKVANKDPYGTLIGESLPATDEELDGFQSLRLLSLLPSTSTVSPSSAVPSAL